jgi:hypothetical protein
LQTFTTIRLAFKMLNGDIETDFELDESSEVSLRISNDNETNREKVTAQDLGSTSYSAKLKLVQYGKWDGEEAVLLGFLFEFRFKNESVKRLTSANVRLTLEETKDSGLTDPSPRNPRNDPQVVMITPAQVCGTFSTESKSRHWSLTVPIKYSGAGVEAGLEPEGGEDTDFDRDHRMWINGWTDSDDEHHEDNVAGWEIQENKIQKSGILHRFPAALVALLPKNPEHCFKMTCHVTTSIALSVNPARLLPKKDDATFFDRSTTKGKQVAPGTDFKSEDFPWDQVVHIAEQYAV